MPSKSSSTAITNNNNNSTSLPFYMRQHQQAHQQPTVVVPPLTTTGTTTPFSKSLPSNIGQQTPITVVVQDNNNSINSDNSNTATSSNSLCPLCGIPHNVSESRSVFLFLFRYSFICHPLFRFVDKQSLQCVAAESLSSLFARSGFRCCRSVCVILFRTCVRHHHGQCQMRS